MAVEFLFGKVRTTIMVQALKSYASSYTRFNRRRSLIPGAVKLVREVCKMSQNPAITEKEIGEICAEPDESTKEFIMQQTMYRIKDPKRSLKFYTEVLGMRLLQKLDFPAMKFSLYFMGYEKADDIPSVPKERIRWTFTRKATIELTHNWGTENEDKEVYHNGNSDPRGFGHIGLNVPDVYKACERFEKLGVAFVKKPDEGKMKGLAFIKDPDGYWIEILSANQMSKDL